MPHYPYCSSAILQIFLCCVCFGNCCQMLTIWTLSSFLKAAVPFCVEDASMPGSRDVRNCIMTWGDLAFPLGMSGWSDGEQKGGQSTGFRLALSSPSSRISNAAWVSWSLSATSMRCWSLKVFYWGKGDTGGKVIKGELNDQLYSLQSPIVPANLGRWIRNLSVSVLWSSRWRGAFEEICVI